MTETPASTPASFKAVLCFFNESMLLPHAPAHSHEPAQMHLPGRANAYPNLLEKRNAAKDNVGFVSGDADTTPSDFGIPPRTFVVVVKEVVLFPSVLFLSPPLAALAMAFATVSSFLSASKIASYTPCDLSQSFSCSCSFFVGASSCSTFSSSPSIGITSSVGTGAGVSSTVTFSSSSSFFCSSSTLSVAVASSSVKSMESASASCIGASSLYRSSSFPSPLKSGSWVSDFPSSTTLSGSCGDASSSFFSSFTAGNSSISPGASFSSSAATDPSSVCC
mmetsp:Transcript_1917/g.6124  ORF Transcript_1917/g.6124 Transcript_1917/m.6124 type:complete len:278 (-) Transcript_1917:5065-5898(-)